MGVKVSVVIVIIFFFSEVEIEYVRGRRRGNIKIGNKIINFVFFIKI